MKSRRWPWGCESRFAPYINGPASFKRHLQERTDHTFILKPLFLVIKPAPSDQSLPDCGTRISAGSSQSSRHDLKGAYRGSQNVSAFKGTKGIGCAPRLRDFTAKGEHAKSTMFGALRTRLYTLPAVLAPVKSSDVCACSTRLSVLAPK